MSAFCPNCLAETAVDTLLACSDCGHFHGYSEAEPEPVTPPQPMFLAPVAGPTSLVDALWKYAGRLAGGGW